jgi:16S rRNA U516 pseudouridylate synthase RsuA-like enzyme
MLESLDNEVIYLRRDRVGLYELGDLKCGNWEQV